MKKIIILLLAAASLVTAKGLKEEISSLNFFKKTGVQVKQVYNAGSLYIVKGSIKRNGKTQPIKLYVTKDKKVVIQGKTYGEDLNELSIPIDMKQFIGKEAFKIGKGKKTYFVWTDPECPYCKKMKLLLEKEKLFEKATFYFYFFPLDFHKNAKDMTAWILSQKTDKERWKALSKIAHGTDKEAWKGYEKKASSKVKNLMKQNMEDAEEVGVRGTPAVYDIHGKSVSWAALPKILKK